jgi:hypothetical protein
MKNIILTLVIATGLAYASLAQAETIPLEKRDYLNIIVSSYVNGFNEFDTTIVTFDDSISVGIYYDSNEQDESRAKKLADRFRHNLPSLLEKYDWADDISVLVSVYGENDARDH